jgi:hypothetical protein
MNGNKGAFVKVDIKTGGSSEVVKKAFEICRVLRDGFYNDEGIVSILKDRAREIVDKRVEKKSLAGGLEEKLL